MKNFARIALSIFFIAAAVITINQAYNFRINAEEPITSAITPTPTEPPLTSPITPTPTEEVTPTPTAEVTPTPTIEVTSTPTVTPTPSSNSGSNNSNSNSGSSSNSNSNPSAPSCGEAKPGNAPQITSVRRTGVKQLTIMWTKALDPVSYYLIAYGTKSGTYEYATAPIGDSNTTSYTINELTPNKTYYFVVRGGHGCMPGDYSPEVSAKVSGKIGASTLGIATKQIGISGVSGLGASPKVYNLKKEITGPVENPVIPAPTVQNTTHSQGLIQKISSFFKGLFN